MSIKIRKIKTRLIKENDNTYSVACSALGVYGSGKTKQDAKSDFLESLDLHLSVLRKKALEISYPEPF